MTWVPRTLNPLNSAKSPGVVYVSNFRPVKFHMWLENIDEAPNHNKSLDLIMGVLENLDFFDPLHFTIHLIFSTQY